jgi:hypothetical protein
MPMLPVFAIFRRWMCARDVRLIWPALFCWFVLCGVAAGCGADENSFELMDRLDVLSAAEHYDEALH